jgi:hypothetical protein
MRVSYVVMAVWASGCVVNGKAFVPSATGVGSAGAASGREDAEARLPPPPPGPNDGLPPYPDAPADPWAAVAGDQPRRMKQTDADQFRVREDLTKCTAARDHCLPAQAWFIAKPLYDREAHAEVMPAVLGTEAPIAPSNTGSRYPFSETYTAFRTVPATRANLVPGAIVIGRGHGYVAESAAESWGGPWYIGTLASVDYNAGSYKLATAHGADGDDMPLSFARVAVLSWQPGAKVQIVGGRSRDTLAVKASDVFMPRSQ